MFLDHSPAVTQSLQSMPHVALPDVVAHSRAAHAGALQWVGMHAIELPLRIAAGGEVHQLR